MENDEDANGDRVNLMTLHGAKGWSSTRFFSRWRKAVPNQRALDEGGLKSLEEERRLAYVGLTRAAAAPSSATRQSPHLCNCRPASQPFR